MNIIKFSANYGSIAGLACFGLFILFSMIGLNPFNGWNVLIAVIPFFFIFLGIKTFRDKENSGYLNFGTGFRVSLFITFFYSSLFAILVFMYLQFVNSDLVIETKNITMENMEKLESTLSSEMYDKMIEGVENMSAGQIAWGRYWNNLIWGVIIGLILAGILKKDKNIFEE
jgi:ABC-type uncharacterized transport system permease subunit